MLRGANNHATINIKYHICRQTMDWQKSDSENTDSDNESEVDTGLTSDDQ